MARSTMPAPPIKSRWYRMGQSALGSVTVMAVADDWVMVRYPRAAPFCVHLNTWHSIYVRAPEARGRGAQQ